MNISARIFELIVFLCSITALVALQFSGHVSAPLNDALFAVMGASAGHGMGALSAQGTVAHITLPESATTGNAKP